MKLTTEDVSAFFAHKGATEVCPFCGTTEWFYDDHMELNLPAVPSDMMRSDEGPNSLLYGGLTRGVLSSVIIMCLNCGFVRPHARRLIEDWVSKKQDGQNDNDK